MAACFHRAQEKPFQLAALDLSQVTDVSYVLYPVAGLGRATHSQNLLGADSRPFDRYFRLIFVHHSRHSVVVVD